MPGDGGERESRLRVYVGEDLSAPRRGADGLCVRRPMRPALTSRPFGVVEAAPCFVAGSTAPHGFPSRESRLRVYVAEDLSAPRRGADGLCVRRPMRPALTSPPSVAVEAAPCFVAGRPAAPR